MHDPMTVAFEIRRPWREKPSQFWPKGYRPTWITIWHVDPETDGSDDSCGWTYPRLSEADKRLAREMADWEMTRPFFFAQPWTEVGEHGVREIAPGECAALVLEAWRQFAWRLDRRDLSPRLVARALESGTGQHDSFRSTLVPFERGYQGHDRRREYEHRFMLLLRAYRRETRPWYRHPRWHIRHWQIQVRPLQDLKRWLFTRCATCGGRFKPSDSVVSDSWHGEGPRWFKGERNLHHSRCHRSRPMQAAPTPEVPHVG